LYLTESPKFKALSILAFTLVLSSILPATPADTDLTAAEEFCKSF
jgi:hypothetical protein